MVSQQPAGELDARFSSDGASPTPWADAAAVMEEAAVYWIATVRPDGRPHVTPIAGLWLDETLYFCTGPGERKAKNLAENRNVIITTGCNGFEGLDVVVEGGALPISDTTRLQRLADAYEAKYPGVFGFRVRDAAFRNGGGGEALVFEVAATKAFGFSKGEPFSQTRWRF